MTPDVILFNELSAIIQPKSKIKLDRLIDIIADFEIKEKSTSVPLSAWKERFLETKKAEGVRPSTLNYYEAHLDRVCKLFGEDKCPEDIARTDFDKIMLDLDKTEYSQNSKWQVVSTIRIFWNWLEGENAISKNFMHNVKYKQKHNTRHPLTEIDVEKMRQACENIEEKAVFEFLITTGCRAGELSGITFNDIDFNSNTCEVTGKGQKKRTVMFTEDCANYIHELVNDRTDGTHIFCRVNASKKVIPISEGYLQATIKRISKRTDIKDSVYCHRLRHTFASSCLDKGMDLVSIQKLLGHSSISTTQVYAELNTSQIRREYDKIYG